ncbi:MAG: hypothetical protein LC768_16735 [Acidobacteria bacterium]|nr:hypothetical protein [Acidobacteriota bacterium]MCA1639946.1 hypothetical protein [Acidobacteriota bacterium]
MKKFISQIFTVLFLATAIFAQGEEQKPIEIDDFGTLPLGDLSARMDGFRNAFKNSKNSSALIKIYGGTKEWLSLPYIRKAIFEAYFLNLNREIEKDKLIIQLCDVGEPEIRTQFFLIPQGVKIEKCEENFSPPKTTALIKSEWLFPLAYTDDYLGTRGIDEATTEALYSFITRLVKKSPESKVYIIGYAGRFFESAGDESEKEVVSGIDSIKVNDKALKQIKNAILRKGIIASRIIAVRGGYKDNHREVEFWFVPKGGEIPKPKPDYFPKKKRSKK